MVNLLDPLRFCVSVIVAILSKVSQRHRSAAKLIERFAAYEWPNAPRVEVSEVSLESETRVVKGLLFYGHRHGVHFETRIDPRGKIVSYKLGV